LINFELSFPAYDKFEIEVKIQKSYYSAVWDPGYCSFGHKDKDYAWKIYGNKQVFLTLHRLHANSYNK